MAALAFMVGAKLANVGVPLLLKDLVDAIDHQARRRCGRVGGAGRPAAWLYGALRLCTSLVH